ncbi:ABC1 family protein [Oesophagostomum dentatum]|uniref:ABC1 family protein n=1 Tax=Oesophagostomum dentatum TaxID=61180 RepID=A0A0B1SW40_OESDE|nr:ABC1 family protein [Oesophagostomum dentatum]
MPVRASTSTLRWCREEGGPILKGLQLVLRSQLGYEGRRLEDNFKQTIVRSVIGPGLVNPVKTTEIPSFPSTFRDSAIDAVQRANAIATGIRTYAGLLMQGITPGTGGYTVSPSGEKIYGSSMSPDMGLVSGLNKIADLIAKGAIALPNFAMPNLQKLGEETLEKPYFKESDFVGKKFFRHEGSEGKQQAAVGDLSPEEAEFLMKAAQSVDDMEAAEKIAEAVPTTKTAKVDEHTKDSNPFPNIGAPNEVHSSINTANKVHNDISAGAKNRRNSNGYVYRPSLPFNYTVNAHEDADNMSKSKERKVRGAALKLGQMLSIQDPDTVPASLLEIFERVRHSADFMPLKQVHKQMVASFGKDWRSKFQSFEDRPFAAASIGQVHKAILPDGRKVAVKIQYPGVAEGIDSDIDNLVSVLSLGNIFPKGLFLDKFVEVARRELALECDYLREARAMKKFRELLHDSKDFFVPEVVDSFTTKRVLTAEFVVGKPVDKCVNEPQVVRDYIAGKFIELCLHEIFVWRFMQTDPNWSNFFLGIHPVTGEPRLILLDFGASRSYSKKFVDQYMKIIKAASEKDTKKIIEYSREIGFLTGYESKIMEQAHAESVLIMGETLASDHPYDFSRQSVTKRIHHLIPIMLEHRLSSPPEEIYSLHRKLSGSYLLATKLKAVVSCGGLFNEIYDNFKFGEDGKDIDIDSIPDDTTDTQ